VIGIKLWVVRGLTPQKYFLRIHSNGHSRPSRRDELAENQAFSILVVSSRTQRRISNEESTESSKLNKSRMGRLLTNHPPARPTYFMRALPMLRNSAIAIVTILALLIVPACGSLCAEMSHCSSGAASAESDACHHANMAARSDSEALSSSVSCGQQSPLLAILARSDSDVQLKSVFAADAPVSINNPDQIFSVADRLHGFLSPIESPQQSTPLQSLSVLRI
jgi:hypothetical protein